MKQIKKICGMSIAVLLFLCLCSCTGKHTYPPVTDANDLGGRRVGVNLAWSADYMLTGRDDVTVVRYNTSADLVMALRYGQIDAAAMERPCATEILRCVSGLRVSDQVVATDGLVFAVNIDRTDVLDQLNTFFAGYEGSRAQQELFERLNANEKFAYHKVEAVGGSKVLSVGLPTDSYPYSYVDFETGEYAGSEVELLTQFANEYGYQLEFTPGVFTTIETGLSLGEFDVAIGSFSNVARTDVELTGEFWMTRPYMQHEIVLIEAADPGNMKILTPLD